MNTRTREVDKFRQEICRLPLFVDLWFGASFSSTQNKTAVPLFSFLEPDADGGDLEFEPPLGPAKWKIKKFRKSLKATGTFGFLLPCLSAFSCPSFPKFYTLRDVPSGAKADDQIRCSQTWAVPLPFSILPRPQEQRVVDAVFETLYTPFGLRTLGSSDPEFRPFTAEAG